MKTVNVALLALIISATSSPVVLAGDTIEAAATELSAINSGMSQSEIEQKITRFLERTDNSPAAYTYLTEHHYIPSETPDTTQTLSRQILTQDKKPLPLQVMHRHLPGQSTPRRSAVAHANCQPTARRDWSCALSGDD